MTTPDTTETLEEITERIVTEWQQDLRTAKAEPNTPRGRAARGAPGLRTRIISALRERDLRAARIIKEHRESDVCKDNCWTTITNEILGKEGN